MAGKWKTMPFNQCAELIKDTVHPSEVRGHPYVGLEHISEGQLSISKYGLADQVTSIKLRFQKGDILFGKLRPYFRKVVIAPFDGVCSTDIWVVRSKPGIDQRYLFYWMASYEFIEESTRASEGTRMPRAQWEFVGRITKPIPPLKEQRAIAHILGTLDDKIELNRKMNETLEQMARALFKSWFVDFEPVRAKMEGKWKRGKSLPGMPAKLYDLFPNRLVNSELGEIPEGWRVGKPTECCIKVYNGGTPRRNENRFWNRGNIPWLTSGEVRKPIIIITENYITEEGLAESSAKWVPPFSTVVALYGATAGQVSLTALRLTTNQAVCALIPKKSFAFFNYHTMRLATGELTNKAVGSAQQNISKKIIEDTKLVLPSDTVVNIFNEMVTPFFVQWISNLHQSRTLAALRDALLPKLISGEIRIKDAERFLRRRV